MPVGASSDAASVVVLLRSLLLDFLFISTIDAKRLLMLTSSVSANQSSIEPELNSLHNKLTAEITRDEADVEALQKRIKKNEALLHAIRASLPTSGTATGYGAKVEIVRQAIQQMSKQTFTQNDVK